MTTIAEYKQIRKDMERSVGLHDRDSFEIGHRRTGRTTEMLLKVLLEKNNSRVICPRQEWAKHTMAAFVRILDNSGIPYDVNRSKMAVIFRSFGSLGLSRYVSFTSEERMKSITKKDPMNFTNFWDQK